MWKKKTPTWKLSKDYLRGIAPISQKLQMIMIFNTSFRHDFESRP